MLKGDAVWSMTCLLYTSLHWVMFALLVVTLVGVLPFYPAPGFLLFVLLSTVNVIYYCLLYTSFPHKRRSGRNDRSGSASGICPVCRQLLRNSPFLCGCLLYTSRALYEKMGFRITGVKPDAIRLKDGALLNEYSMMRKIKRQPSALSKT